MNTLTDHRHVPAHTLCRAYGFLVKLRLPTPAQVSLLFERYGEHPEAILNQMDLSSCLYG